MCVVAPVPVLPAAEAAPLFRLGGWGSPSRRTYAAVRKVERDMQELHDQMVEVARLVEESGEQLDRIEEWVSGNLDNVTLANEELLKANKISRRNRRRKCCLCICLIVLVLVLVYPLLSQLPSGNGGNDGNGNGE
jgi:t-SNARE complex subunit (syntaxin)